MSGWLLVTADASGNAYHQFARAQAMTQWWQWLLLLIVVAVVIAYVVVAYFFDAVEMPRARGWMLVALRVLAFLGILFFFLDLEKRSERRVVKASRAALLVDTSLSMGIQDAGSSSNRRRVDAVIDELTDGDLIERLRASHDVVVYQFDQNEVPVEVASFARDEVASSDEDTTAEAVFQQSVAEARMTCAVAGVIAGVATVAFLAYLVVGTWSSEGRGAWLALVAMVGVIAAVVIVCVANLRYPDVDLLTTLWLKAPEIPDAVVQTQSGESDAVVADDTEVDWSEELAPQGSETRLGDALRYVVNKERDGSIAGIVLLTDGGQNSGIDFEQSVSAARSAGIPVFPIGLGSDKRPANVRIVDLEAPPRVYPGDSFSLAGYVQAYGLSGRTVKVELLSSPSDSEEAADEVFEEDRSVKLGEDGEIVPLRFEVSPTEQGWRTYRLRVIPPTEDQEARDNERSAKTQIVQRKNRVLLMAGGPSREFRFLRNLLYRDRDSTLAVYLQSGQPGMSQEADELLYEFPRDADELFDYDCIVAFDPNWLALDDLQVQLLERWVAEQAGGLIVVAGPVHTPRWAGRLRGDTRVDTIKGLYPVLFYSRGSATLSLGRFASETPWQLEFTRDGLESEFLWLEDDQVLSMQAWTEFAGVYGYYAVKDPKPGARVFARFSDPSTALDGDLPIYLAGHFYGAGRVFFQASGEMWRIRQVDDAFFERYYTKLIRWASQGRLLRDSNRGVLLVDKDRCLLGDQVSVQAILTDSQHQPLVAPEVTASLTDPTGRVSPLVMRRVENAARDGMYATQFTASLEGPYQVELQPPHGDEGDLLTREVRARIPALETERPERNDALLRYVAEQTGGDYYVGIDSAMNRGSVSRAPLVGQIEPQDQVTYLSGTPDKKFEQLLMTWLMGIICGALCIEWLIRRLSKLA